MASTTDIASLAALIGNPARAAMLLALLGGQALTAGELAEVAGVTPQTASGHLEQLRAAGLIRAWAEGRRRRHALGSGEVAQLLEALHLAVPSLASAPPQALAAAPDPAPRRRAPLALREARSCYDHLAGRVGVALAEALAVEGDVGGALSARGEAALRRWGLDLDTLRAPVQGRRPRVFCRPCLDWSERRPHLAGALGAAILTRALETGWLRRTPGARALNVTPAGREGLRRVFGVD
ncbi:MAG: helix-turn-helix transcriptional regulator [Alphaproteobacteria bacterium]|nr:helix-turn-helix transcriptional regulator [Alphaproteobacteria bacterium]